MFNSPNIKVFSTSFTPSNVNCKPTGAPSGTNVDLTKRIKAMCDKQSTCVINVDGNTLGDPSPGCRKKFQIKYACGDNRTTNSLAVTDDSTLNIACNKGTEPFTTVGKDGRVYKTLPPCKMHGMKCPYYWDCRPNLSCPEGFHQMFYTAGDNLQVFQ